MYLKYLEDKITENQKMNKKTQIERLRIKYNDWSRLKQNFEHTFKKTFNFVKVCHEISYIYLMENNYWCHI